METHINLGNLKPGFYMFYHTETPQKAGGFPCLVPWWERVHVRPWPAMVGAWMVVDAIETYGKPMEIPMGSMEMLSGKRFHKYGTSPYFSWVNYFNGCF